jgi:nucleoid DNA-binding protein
MATNAKPSTKTEIMNYIAEETDLKKKDVAAVFDAMSAMIKKDLNKAGMFSVPGLMKIKVIKKPAVPARKGVNPFTGEEMMFKAKPARNVVKISPLKSLKEMV